MAQYSEDLFLDPGVSVMPEYNYQNQRGVWQTRKLTQRQLAQTLSPVLEECRIRGDPFIDTYQLLRNSEIRAKCGPENETGLISTTLKIRRKQAIRQKYDHKRLNDPDKLQEFFYRILKERKPQYTLAQINALSTQLGVQLDYDVYLEWFELNQ